MDCDQNVFRNRIKVARIAVGLPSGCCGQNMCSKGANSFSLVSCSGQDRIVYVVGRVKVVVLV